MQQGLGRGQRRAKVPVWWQGQETDEPAQAQPGKMPQGEHQQKEGPSPTDTSDWWDSDAVTGGVFQKASGSAPRGEEMQAATDKDPSAKKLEWAAAEGSNRSWGGVEIPEIPVNELDEEEAEQALKPPPLEDITEDEEEESIAVEDKEELDAAIEAAREEAETIEGEDLDRIHGMAETAKHSPYMQELMGIKNPIIMGYVYAAGLRKVQELELVHGEREKKDLLSYSKLAYRFNVDKKELQECCVVGKLKATGKRKHPKQDKRIMKFRKNTKDDPSAGPSSSQPAAEAT